MSKPISFRDRLLSRFFGLSPQIDLRGLISAHDKARSAALSASIAFNCDPFSPWAEWKALYFEKKKAFIKRQALKRFDCDGF